jgi:phytoene dehydrogenase-like protein
VEAPAEVSPPSLPKRSSYDAVVVGAGPNGLSAAVALAQAGMSVLVVEARPTLGGGARSAELTLPGFVHDVCSAIHPMGAASPYLRTLPLERHGLEWVHPPLPLAHPFDDGTAVALHRSWEETARGLGRDERGYVRLMRPLAERWEALFADAMGRPFALPRHPLLLARFGMRALLPATWLARLFFRDRDARALFIGIAAHGIVPLERPITAAAGLMLALAGHGAGWPMAKGGSQRIVDALASYLRALGGETVTGWAVRTLDELPRSRVVMFDGVPQHLARIAEARLPASYRDALLAFRHGPGSFKVDWALDGPIPWRAELCTRAATVHLGPSMEDMAESERVIWHGVCPERPYTLVVQQSPFDPSRAPAGKHTAWGYCHVPHGSSVDMTERIEAQVERFAPGFRARILARAVTPPAGLAAYNANYVGGDITGGVVDVTQLFTRPVARWVPYATPVPGLYICSSSTPPGPGVHGMCGYWAAQAALRAHG